MKVDLFLNHWYCIVKNTEEYQQVKLVCDYYGRKSALKDNFIIEEETIIYNGYEFLSSFSTNSSLFNPRFKKNFIEISLDFILNYNIPKENI